MTTATGRETLQQTIEAVYAQFAQYRLWQLPDACPCCITPEENATLWTVALRELTDEQLQLYAFKAMTTWGSAVDFQHFLPRLLELITYPESKIDKDAFLGKMEMAGWATWPIGEQATVQRMLLEWWTWHIQHECFHEELIAGWLVRFLGSIEPLLARWEVSFDNWSFENLVETIIHSPSLLRTIKRINSEPALVAACQVQLSKWLQTKLPLLESGFFLFEPLNPEFAQRVSWAYDMVLANQQNKA